MSPAPKRGNSYEDEMMVSWDNSDPSLPADTEGWLNYRIDTNRWKVWDGTSWKTLVLSPVPTAEIDDDAVTFAKMQNIATDRLLGRDAAGSGNVEEIAMTTGGMLEFDGAGGIRVKSAGLAGALLRTKVDGTLDWLIPANFPCYLMHKSSSGEVLAPPISGTSFPTSPVDGQLFYHTTHRQQYSYDATVGGWLSVWRETVWFGCVADVSTSIFLNWSPSVTLFASNFGPIYGFQTKIVGMGLYMNNSGTCAISAYGSGSAISSSTLSLSSQVSKTDEAMASATIAAGTYLGIKRDSGTVEGPAMGYFTVRRFET